MNPTLQKQINDCIICLEYIAAGVNPSDVDAGLCLNTGLDIVLNELATMNGQGCYSFRHIFYSDWPEYSEDVVFPVPFPARSLDVFRCYEYTKNKYEGEYGESRRRLAAYCAAKLRTYL